jgi:cytochrome c oxidase subunit IV
VLAALWGIGMLAMVLLWSIMAWGVAGPLRDTLLGLWLAIAATLLVATFLQRGWQRELAERDNAVEPAQPTRLSNREHR